MWGKQSAARTVTQMALFMAAALVLSWLEAVLPFQIPIPGVKLGLANIVTLFVLYEYSFPAALLFGVLRVLLSSLFLGRVSGLLFGLAGAVLAVIAMGILKKIPCFSSLSVSVAGAIFHGVGQLAVSSFVYTPAVWSLLPLMGVCSAFCGIITWVPLRILSRYSGVFRRKRGQNLNKE